MHFMVTSNPGWFVSSFLSSRMQATLRQAQLETVGADEPEVGTDAMAFEEGGEQGKRIRINQQAEQDQQYPAHEGDRPEICLACLEDREETVHAQRGNEQREAQAERIEGQKRHPVHQGV